MRLESVFWVLNKGLEAELESVSQVPNIVLEVTLESVFWVLNKVLEAELEAVV